MTFEPKYRGKERDLQREARDALEWLAGIVRSLNFSDEHWAEIEPLLEKACKGEKFALGGAIGCRSFRVAVERSWGGYRALPRDQLTDFFYEFQVGNNVRTSYGQQKILIRKDGTVNVENLEAALYRWAREIIGAKKRSDTLAHNERIYNMCQKPGLRCPDVEVELSRTQRDMATMTMWDTSRAFKYKATVRIENLQSVINNTRAQRDIIVRFAEEMR